MTLIPTIVDFEIVVTCSACGAEVARIPLVTRGHLCPGDPE